MMPKVGVEEKDGEQEEQGGKEKQNVEKGTTKKRKQKDIEKDVNLQNKNHTIF